MELSVNIDHRGLQNILNCNRNYAVVVTGVAGGE